MMGARILQGDCLEILKTLSPNSIDALVTDPPAGISFMGKAWDGDKGGRNQWIAWLSSVMVEALRVLKPGAHALVWAIPRTSHWTATAIEDAGFEVRHVIHHHFGSGFPKSLSVDKAISPDGKHISIVDHGMGIFGHEGEGTALKPATEHWILARVPLEGTVSNNVLKHGTGGLNVDGCRVAAKGRPLLGQHVDGGAHVNCYGDGLHGSKAIGTTDQGRWPPDLLLTHSALCTDCDCTPCCPVREIGEQSGESLSTGGTGEASKAKGGSLGWKPSNTGGKGDTGTAARFFPTFRYEAKPSTAEREQGVEHKAKHSAGELTGGRKEGSAGLDNPRAGAGRTSKGRANTHPTVKPIALMQWLCRLITPPGGVVLDPFCGSGSTGIAALREGFTFVGVEMSSEYAEIARDRINGDAPLFNRVAP